MLRVPSRENAKNWRRFVENLQQLNLDWEILRMRFLILKDTVKFCRENTIEKDCPHWWGSPQYIEYTGNAINKIGQQMFALNNAYNFTQTRQALLDDTVKGDIDIVGLKQELTLEETKLATFDKSKLPGDPMGPRPELGFLPFIPPLLIKGTIAIVALVTACIAAVKSCDTVTKKYDKEIIVAQIKQEKEFAKDPQLFDKWTQYKKEVQKAPRGLLDKYLGAGAGDIAKGGIGLAVLLVVGLLGWNLMTKAK